ncbi:hypothetical protein HY732_00445 [Candidatus Uhrbacteria bacterium]|nr:hypothetical protein [Candidatus Uhrbacteria bacterium]
MADRIKAVHPRQEYCPFDRPSPGDETDVPDVNQAQTSGGASGTVDTKKKNPYQKVLESMRLIAQTSKSRQSEEPPLMEDRLSRTITVEGVDRFVDMHVTAGRPPLSGGDGQREGLFVRTFAVARLGDVRETVPLAGEDDIAGYIVEIGIRDPYYFCIAKKDPAFAEVIHREIAEEMRTIPIDSAMRAVMKLHQDIKSDYPGVLLITRITNSEDAASMKALLIGADVQSPQQDHPKPELAEEWWNPPLNSPYTRESYMAARKEYQEYADMPDDGRGTFVTIAFTGDRECRAGELPIYGDEILSARMGGVMILTRGGSSDRNKRVVSKEDIDSYYVQNGYTDETHIIINAGSDKRDDVMEIQKEICAALRSVASSAVRSAVKDFVANYKRDIPDQGKTKLHLEFVEGNGKEGVADVDS